MRIDIIAQDNNVTGESPIWDASGRRLIWSDIDGGFVYEYYPHSGKKSIICEGINVFGIALNARGGYIVGRTDGLYFWKGGSDFTLIAGECDGEVLCINDIAADAKGRIYAGSFHWDESGMRKPGKLYLIAPDGSVSVQDEGILLANGIAIGPDDRTLYFADSAARKIFRYDIDPESGNLSGRRVFAEAPETSGIPDGLTVDAEGCVWCAQWYGSKVVRYSQTGEAIGAIEMPVTQVSSIAFGGDDLGDLYITTAGGSWPSDLMPPGYDPDTAVTGGSLYRVRPGVFGKAEHKAGF